MAVLVRYSTGATMTYHLTAYAPWEGYRVMVNGSRGRLELEVVESDHVSPGRRRRGQGRRPARRRGRRPSSGGATLTLRPFWRPPRRDPGRGLQPGRARRRRRPDDRGALRRRQPDPLGRAATARDGALALLTGLAANRSFETGRPGPRRRPAHPAADTGDEEPDPRADVRPHRPAPAARPGPARAWPASCTPWPRSSRIISPHGHVDPALLAEDRPFPDPARLLIVPDHYLTRMLLSQGVPPADLGVPTPRRQPGARPTAGRSGDASPRTGTCSGAPRRGSGWSRPWPTVFGVAHPARPGHRRRRLRRARRPGSPSRSSGRGRCSSGSASRCSPPPSRRWTTSAAHAKLAADGWGGPGGRVVTTFRPDDVVDLEWRRLGRPAWTGSAS